MFTYLVTFLVSLEMQILLSGLGEGLRALLGEPLLDRLPWELERRRRRCELDLDLLLFFPLLSFLFSFSFSSSSFDWSPKAAFRSTIGSSPGGAGSGSIKLLAEAAISLRSLGVVLAFSV